MNLHPKVFFIYKFIWKRFNVLLFHIYALFTVKIIYLRYWLIVEICRVRIPISPEFIF